MQIIIREEVKYRVLGITLKTDHYQQVVNIEPIAEKQLIDVRGVKVSIEVKP